jgi:hypothetical protein
MDAAYVSALAALAGSAIGGMTSFATSWTTQHAQTRVQKLNRERDRRENLFGQFIDEASKLYADALQNERDEVSQFIGIYALINRMRLVSSSRVVDSADRVTRTIIETYRAPNRNLHELASEAALAAADPLREFAEACRDELSEFGPL